MSLPTVYLVRHATPDWSRTDIPYHLPPGPPLIEKGEKEAVQLGEFLRDMGVRQLFHSPLERCARTAALAAAVAGAEAVLDVRLAEQHPNEPPAEVLARVWPVWVHAGERCLSDGPIALVSHGGPIQRLLTELGLEAKLMTQYKNTFDHNNPLPPAGAWRAVRANPDGPWTLDLAFTPDEHRAKAWYV
jgi:broad specificity phosphatase PhoE